MPSEADCAFLLCPDVPGLVLYGGGCNDYSILRSTDDGGTWEIVLDDWPYTVSVIKQDPFDQSHLIAAAIGSSISVFYQSSDHGLNWTQSSLTFSGEAVTDILFSDEIADRYLCATDNGIYITEDGENFTQVLDCSTFTLESDTKRPGEIYASCGDEGVFLSLDDGFTWEPLPSFYRNDISVVALEIVGENLLYAGTEAFGAFRMDLDDLGISDSSSPSVPGISVVETPAYGSVSLIVPASDSASTLSIFDLSGRVVFSENMPSAASVRNIDVSGLTPGVYFAGFSGNSSPCRFVVLHR